MHPKNKKISNTGEGTLEITAKCQINRRHHRFLYNKTPEEIAVKLMITTGKHKHKIYYIILELLHSYYCRL